MCLLLEVLCPNTCFHFRCDCFSNGSADGSKITNGNGTIKNEIAFKSGGIGPSTNIQGLLLTFNPLMELFQKLGKNYYGVQIEEI